jgi:L-seryl-tRNA(Ser) seleniumtransferase
VEIGGGFRVPEVMAESGAHLVEVGTTNRTRATDFARALDDPDAAVALLMKVHQSNYRITGFTEQVDVAELAELVRTDGAGAAGVAVVADIGSGLLDVACPWLADGPPSWLAGEPAARQTLEAGADLVVFSGDKLLGGPQAGIIAGRSDLVAACARHPLARALRPGGLVLAALQELALVYLRRDGDSITFWRSATIPADELRARAEKIVAAVGSAGGMEPGGIEPGGIEPGGIEVVELFSVPGGGTLPGVEIASAGLSIAGDRAADLRAATPPIIARVHEGRTLLDLRTIHPDDDAHVAAVVASLVR